MSDVAGAQLRRLIERIERIERLDSEITSLNDDKKDVYAEAKVHGFDVKIMKKIVAMRRRDVEERQEEEAILELYMQALGMLGPVSNDEPSHVQAHAREDIVRSATGF